MSWKFEDNFAATARAIEEGAREASRRTAEKVLKRAQDAAPVKTGNLRDSGRVVETEDGAEVVFDAPYASQVEEGHFDVTAGKSGGGAFRSGAHFLAKGLAEGESDLEEEGERLLRDLGAK